MNPFLQILTATFAMSLIAWFGIAVLALGERSMRRLLPILVAFAAGSLVGGALLHLLPETVARTGARLDMFVWAVVGFVLFFLLEQFLHWRHVHDGSTRATRHPVGLLILLADGLHNFLGGLAIGGSFLVSPEVGIMTWIASAAHEIPQELGDFAILIRSGWGKRRALVANYLSALTIVPGGVAAYWLGERFDPVFLLPLAAGNFLYIAASDLIPEIKSSHEPGADLVHFVAFLAGIGLLLAVRIAFG